MVRKKFVSIVAALALVLAVALMPMASPVMAAVNQTATGSFTVGNVAPTVVTPTVSPTTWTPMSTEVTVNVTVTDPNGHSDISWVLLEVYNGTKPTSEDGKRFASINWTTGGFGTLDQGSCTSWAQGSSSQSGDLWTFKFTPGKIARAANDWNVTITATDANTTPNSDSKTVTGNSMNKYGEISLASGTVDWGSLDPGTENSTQVDVATYIANCGYSEQVKTVGSWSGNTLNTIGTPGADEFSLRAYYNSTLASAIVVNTTYQDIRAGCSASDTESGATESNNSLWLSLGSPFTAGTYSGTITYKIAT